MGVTHFLLLFSLSVVVTAQDCGRPELGEAMVLRGDAVLQETFQDGSSVSLGCNPGYQSSGRSSLTCRRGSWSTLRMICQKRNCGSAGEVYKGDIEYPEGTLFGAVLQVRCNPGFKRVGGTRVMRCDVRGWNGRLPVCEAVVCEEAPQVENANVRPLKDSYHYRDSIKYTCPRDYTLIGQASLTCSDEGTFTPDPPECKNVQCAEPIVNNGRWDGGARPPYTYLSTVILKCDDGYQMEGDGAIMCEKDNNWSPQLPTCKPVPCEVPPAVENANVSPVKESYHYRDSIEYTCVSNYTLIGQASLTCSKDGTFTPDPPECRHVQCGEPVLKNGHWEAGARPPYTYLSTVILRCDDGYQMEGDSAITCEKDNNWSPQLPTCKPVPCEVPRPVEHASVSPAKESYEYRDSIEYTCLRGYTLIGQASLTCSKDGTFTPDPPECRLIPTTPKATTTTPSTTTTTSPKKPGVGGRDDDFKPELPDNGGDSIGKRVWIPIAVLVVIAVIIIGVVVYKKQQRSDAVDAPTLLRSVKIPPEEECF